MTVITVNQSPSNLLKIHELMMILKKIKKPVILGTLQKPNSLLRKWVSKREKSNRTCNPALAEWTVLLSDCIVDEGTCLYKSISMTKWKSVKELEYHHFEVPIGWIYTISMKVARITKERWADKNVSSIIPPNTDNLAKRSPLSQMRSLDPAASLQEIPRMKERPVLHQKYAISKTHTLGYCTVF